MPSSTHNQAFVSPVFPLRTTRRTSSSSNRAAPRPKSTPPSTRAIVTSRLSSVARAKPRDLDIVLCHAVADFDTLAAAVGLAKLRGPHCRVVIPAGVHVAVRRYLTLHKSFFPLLDVKAVDPTRLRWVGVADTHSVNRLGVAADWLQQAEIVSVVDHHSGSHSNDISQHAIPGILEYTHEAVGAVSTIVVERLQLQPHLTLSEAEATLLALAIHTDTGSLTFENTTPRDAQALAWLLKHGACQRSISQFARNYLTQQQQRLLSNALDLMTIRTIDGLSVAHVVLQSDEFVKGMAGVTQSALELSNLDALVLAIVCPAGRKRKDAASAHQQVSIIGRAQSRVDGVDFNKLFQAFGGGGHAQAASASTKVKSADDVIPIVQKIMDDLVVQLPPPVLARDFMSTNVVSVHPTDSMAHAAEVLFESGHTGLAVVQSQSGKGLIGVVSRRDVELSEMKGLLHTPVKGWVARKVIAITPDTPLHEAEAMLVDNNIGRLPVVEDGVVIGIVTRSDVLVQRRLCNSF